MKVIRHCTVVEALARTMRGALQQIREIPLQWRGERVFIGNLALVTFAIGNSEPGQQLSAT